MFQARTKELEGLQQKVEELQAQVQSMEGTKGWFERRLKEAEVSVNSAAPSCGRCHSERVCGSPDPVHHIFHELDPFHLFLLSRVVFLLLCV